MASAPQATALQHRLVRWQLADPSAALRAVCDRLRSERGGSMVEYALLLSFALIVAFAMVQVFGQRVLGLFEAVWETFDANRPNQNPAA